MSRKIVLSEDSVSSNEESEACSFFSGYSYQWLEYFITPSGQQMNFDENTTEYNVFPTFFDGEVIDFLVTETNRYSESVIEEKGGLENLSTHSRLRKWKNVDNLAMSRAMRCFLAILLLMGLDRKPSYEAYWTSEWTMEAPGFRSIMSRDRFLLILQLLHCANNDNLVRAGQPNHDRRGKINEFMDMLVSRWQAAYYPDREIAIDETIIPFKGRTSMKVYKPQKPHKWGLNCWKSQRLSYTRER